MNNWPKWIVVIGVLVLAACCCTGIFDQLQILSTLVPQLTITVPEIGTPRAPTPVPTFALIPVDPAAYETVDTLSQTIVPVNDPRELAERLKGIADIPETMDEAIPDYQIGDEREFWATNVDTNQNFQVTAVLRYIGENTLFWIEKGVDFDEGDLEELAGTFDQKIYPTVREFFGSEWSPGIDNDARLYIMYIGGLGYSLAGYFSSADEVHPLAHPYSNAHEAFFMNSDNVGLNDDYAYGVLAHEFQHMIHWYRDRNEESWLNEGFSELSTFLNGYDTGGFDYSFAYDPDLQLNDWPNDPNATGPHYGSGFLFVTYFLDRFGEEATKALVANQNNGMSSIDEVLAGLHAVDALTGNPIRADDVFSDWVLTNYLNDAAIGDGRFTYSNYPGVPSFYDTEEINDCPVDWKTRTVSQYGTDYIKIDCDGNYTINFEGNTMVSVVPEDPHSGKFAFWSNKGDESDMTLTQSFDFTGVSGPITLSYWTWYNLEADYDYLYLEVSEDGQEWTILQTPSGTDENPSGNSYGWGYNADSDEWIQETVDLSDYAGKTVQLRFEYITDAAVNGEGLLLDDISIPELNYSTDFETNDGGWEAAGFVRIQNILPQTFRVSLIQESSDTSVETFDIQPGEPISIPVSIGSGGLRQVTLVVSGTTRFTRGVATYRFSVQP